MCNLLRTTKETCCTVKSCPMTDSGSWSAFVLPFMSCCSQTHMSPNEGEMIVKQNTSLSAWHMPRPGLYLQVNTRPQTRTHTCTDTHEDCLLVSFNGCICIWFYFPFEKRDFPVIKYFKKKKSNAREKQEGPIPGIGQYLQLGGDHKIIDG